MQCYFKFQPFLTQVSTNMYFFPSHSSLQHAMIFYYSYILIQVSPWMGSMYNNKYALNVLLKLMRSFLNIVIDDVDRQLALGSVAMVMRIPEWWLVTVECVCPGCRDAAEVCYGTISLVGRLQRCHSLIPGVVL